MDCTQANAVPGPSRLPYASPQAGLEAVQTYSSPPPPAPSLPVVDPSGSQAPTQAVLDARPPAKPRIVPTVVAADGVREVPHAFELCEVEDLITLIASMLERLMAHNDRIPLTPSSLTRFHSRAPPSINVRDYLLRIARYTNVEPCCLLMLLPYVDKVCARLNTFTISSLTVHRFIIASVSVGSKALSDSFCTNSRYARVGGVSLTEMNLLEKEFCEALDWRLTSTGTVLAHYYTSLVIAHPAYRLSEAPVIEEPPAPTFPLPTPAMSKKVPLPYVDHDIQSENHDEDDGGHPNSARLSASSGGGNGAHSSSHTGSSASRPDADVEMSDVSTDGVSPAARTNAYSATGSSSSVPSSTPPSVSPGPMRSPHAADTRGRPPDVNGHARSFLASSSSSPAVAAFHAPAHLVSGRTASPALIPPPRETRHATASNLPSPVRGPVDGIDGPDVPSAVAGVASSLSASRNGTATSFEQVNERLQAQVPPSHGTGTESDGLRGDADPAALKGTTKRQAEGSPSLWDGPQVTGDDSSDQVSPSLPLSAASSGRKTSREAKKWEGGS